MVGTMWSQLGSREPTRRQHDRAFKARLVELALQPGASVSAIAMENGINANLLFKWLKDHRRKAEVPDSSDTLLLPVCLAPGDSTNVPVDAGSAAAAPSAGQVSRASVIELEIAGARLRLHGAVNEADLLSVLRAVRQSA
jgi:transposase